MKILSVGIDRAGILQPSAGSPGHREVSERFSQSSLGSMELPAAVFWDMDGTLVDTEPFWIQAQHELAAEHGKQWTEADSLALVGSGLPEAGQYIADTLQSDLNSAQIVDYLSVRVAAQLKNLIPWRPGAPELVTQFAEQGVPQAIVTMSYRRLVEPVRIALGIETAITGDEVAHSKPHPEPYLAAARAIGVDPTDCFAFEDSPTGVRSAESAGCLVIAVPHLIQLERAPRTIVVSSLTGETPESIGLAVQEAVGR